MKPDRRLLFTLATLIIIFIFLPTVLYAQIDPEGDPDAPIDGGIGILLAIGVGYGLKKFRDYKKSDREN